MTRTPMMKTTSDVSDKELLDAVLLGRCPLNSLPPLLKKVVRIFISSTFSDTKEERNALMRNVYPKLADFCRENYGLEFQVVDMRWGVPEQASDNHSTTDLCLQEIRKCQEVSVGPSFVAILGDKYGYRPIPNTIGEAQFSILAAAAAHAKITEDGRRIDWELVEEWYLRDDNATPAVRVLQPVSSKIHHFSDTENAELRKEAHNKWNEINSILCHTLRTAAKKTLEAGQLTAEENQRFLMSVTESEITQGVLGAHTDPISTCFCIVRKIPDIERHLQADKAAKFVDMEESCGTQLDQEAQRLLHSLRDDRLLKWLPRSNLTMVNIEWESSGANVSLETVDDLPVANSAEKFPGEKVQVHKHKEYLDQVCSEFFQKVSKMICLGDDQHHQAYDDVTTEVLQHMHFAKVRCQIFEGRHDVINIVKNYLKEDSNSPLAIYGNSGCGKTSVMSKILSKLRDWCGPDGDLGDCAVVVRFLGTTAQTSNLHQLLVSICRQLCKIYSCEWQDTDKFSDLVAQFHQLMASASKDKQLILLLDSIDQLMPSYNAYKLNWLPSALPAHVKLIVSSIDEGYNIVKALQEKYSSEALLQIKPLGEKLGFQIVEKWLREVDRAMTKEQELVLKFALEQCSLPLYARITFDQIRRWRSYEEPSIESLQTTIRGAINKLFQQIEQKFGQALVKHCLAYITASRYGLSEVELEHILSLDDDLLNKVYQFWRPPVRRIPPLLWTRVRSEISSYIVERSVDDILVLAWYHRQFIETTRERYLSDKVFAQMIHQTTAEYFLGKWGGGKEKPFKYSESQKKRFRLESRCSQADRKVPPQPYIFELSSSGQKGTRYNRRKLTELPFQLHKSKQLDLFKSEAFFNLQWLYGKLKCGSLQSVLEEFEIFMQSEKSLRTDRQVCYLYATLKLIRPYIARYPESLGLELAGRLAHFISSSPVTSKLPKGMGKMGQQGRGCDARNDMARLMQQCDTFGATLCPLTPLLTCYDTADLGLSQIINIRPTEPWSQMGTMSLTSDFKIMHVIDYHENGDVYLASWDVDSGEKIQELPITKRRDDYLTDLYFQAFMDNSSTHMIALYRHKFVQKYGGGRVEETDNCQYRDRGCIDVIRVEDGVVVRTFTAPLDKREYFNPVIFMTDHWLAARFGWKVPMIHLYEEKQHGSSKPHLLVPDENVHVIIRGKKSKVREYVTLTEEESASKIVSVRSTSVHLQTFPHEEDGDLGELDLSESTDAIACTKDGGRIILATGDYGKIHVYKLKKTHALGKGRKPRIMLGLPRNEKVHVAVAHDARRKEREEEEGEGKQSIRVYLFVSPNDEFVMACYQSKREWEAFFWNINWTGNRYVGRVTENQPLAGRFPAFSADSQYIVFVCAKHRRKVHVMSTASGSLVNEYEMTGNIRDLVVSRSTNQCAALLGKDVVFMEIAERSKQGQTAQLERRRKANQDNSEKPLMTGNTHCLLPRELVGGRVASEVQITECREKAVVREVSYCEDSDIDRVSSARKRGCLVVDTVCTPDGLRVVQLSSCLQVVDKTKEQIKYTPREGDTLVRLSVDDGRGNTTTKNIPIGELSNGRASAVELLPGHRIVNTSNKVRYRVPMETSQGSLQLVVVPSCVTVWQENNKELHRQGVFYVYQERIMTVSDKYVVTSKKQGSAVFVNVYDLYSTKLVTTHPVQGTLARVALSADSSRLHVITSALLLKVYEGENFIGHESKINVQSDSTARFAVKDLILFQKNPSRVLVQYTLEGMDGFGTSIYTQVNVETRAISEAMTVQPAFEDISTDGAYAIDSKLAMYDLGTGSIARQIPYPNANVNMQLQVRLSDDNRHVVFIDKQDDTLHVIKLDGQSARLLTSCFAHAPNLPASNGLGLRQSGRILCLRGPRLTLLRLRDFQKEDACIGYSNETQRALSLVPSLQHRGKTCQVDEVTEVTEVLESANMTTTA